MLGVLWCTLGLWYGGEVFYLWGRLVRSSV